jgi:glycosyltransferase involved in cell wall biosynthesis
MDLRSKGGGEAVCMNVLEALQEDYEVTLLTLSDPDITELNRYFNTDVKNITIKRAGVLAPLLNRLVGRRRYILQNALLGRYAQRHTEEFDLVVSTINELGLRDNAIQYVHFPFDWTVSLDNRKEIFHPTVEEDSLYERLCTSIAGVSLRDVQSSTLLANSLWTATVVEDAYDIEPEVLYPPIDTREFEPRPWTTREEGFVTVGRIERSKRVLELIEIIDGLREVGLDQHLHVIGPTADSAYGEEVTTAADSRAHVHLEGELPRSELVELICTHKYGIHGKEFEHFGMSVAELIAGGAAVFVPDNGGQRTIVEDDRQRYSSIEDAIDRITSVIETEYGGRELGSGPAAVDERFGRDRFAERIETLAAEAVSQPSNIPVERTVAASTSASSRRAIEGED